MNTPSYDDYIIRASGKTSFLRRVRDIALTLILWLLYLYFLRDFFDFLWHALAWHLHPQTVAAPDFSVFYILQFYGKIILGMATAFIGWALYNLVRFRGKNRRKNVPVTPVAAVAQMYQVTSEDIYLWQQQRVLVMHHDEQGKLIDVAVRDVDQGVS